MKSRQCNIHWNRYYHRSIEKYHLFENPLKVQCSLFAENQSCIILGGYQNELEMFDFSFLYLHLNMRLVYPGVKQRSYILILTIHWKTINIMMYGDFNVKLGLFGPYELTWPWHPLFYTPPHLKIKDMRHNVLFLHSVTPCTSINIFFFKKYFVITREPQYEHSQSCRAFFLLH